MVLVDRWLVDISLVILSGRDSRCNVPVIVGWDPPIIWVVLLRARLHFLTRARQFKVLLTGPKLLCRRPLTRVSLVVLRLLTLWTIIGILSSLVTWEVC